MAGKKIPLPLILEEPRRPFEFQYPQTQTFWPSNFFLSFRTRFEIGLEASEMPTRDWQIGRFESWRNNLPELSPSLLWPDSEDRWKIFTRLYV